MKNELHSHAHGLSRRAIMQGTLKAGVYAAPVILSSGRVAAAPLPSETPFPATLTFGQDALLADTGARAVFDVYYTLSNQPAGTLTLLGTLPPTDRFGFGGSVFPLTVDARVVTSVTLTYILSGNPSTSPPAATFTSNLVSALNPVNGMRQPVRFVGLVVQEPTVAACQIAPASPTQFTENVDVAILNALPGITYTISVQSNRHIAPVVVTTATTNADGNVTIVAGIVTPVVVATPTSVVVTAVPTGGGPTLTLTASGANGNLTTISCGALQSAIRANVAGTTAQPIGITVP